MLLRQPERIRHDHLAQPARLRRGKPGRLQGTESTQSLVCTDDDVLDVQHGGVPPFVGFFAKLNVISAVWMPGFTGPGRIDGAGLGCGRLLLPQRHLVHVFREAEDKAVLQAKHRYALVV